MSTTTFPPVQQESEEKTKEQPAQQEKKAEAPRKTQIPNLNPYLAPTLFCSNRHCLKPMQPKIVTDRGGESALQYDCEPCNYSFLGSLIHAQGQCKQLGQTKSNLPDAMPRK